MDGLKAMEGIGLELFGYGAGGVYHLGRKPVNFEAIVLSLGISTFAFLFSDLFTHCQTHHGNAFLLLIMSNVKIA